MRVKQRFRWFSNSIYQCVFTNVSFNSKTKLFTFWKINLDILVILSFVFFFLMPCVKDERRRFEAKIRETRREIDPKGGPEVSRLYRKRSFYVCNTRWNRTIVFVVRQVSGLRQSIVYERTMLGIRARDGFTGVRFDLGGPGFLRFVETRWIPSDG